MDTADKPYEFNELEQRIWELMDGDMTTFEIVDHLGLDPVEGLTIIQRIVRHRGTPRLEAVERALQGIREIRPMIYRA